MKITSIIARKQFCAVVLTSLATLFILGLTGQKPVLATDPGFITAKTWVDPANGHSAYGDGSHDDWQNLQDMIIYAIANNEAIKLEPGTYNISKTLMIQNPPRGYHLGFLMSGIGGPNTSLTTWYNSGVSIALVTTDPAQLAVLEVGAGGFYDITLQNMGLWGQSSSPVTKYGLLFAGQNFSHAKIDMIGIAAVDTGFGIDTISGVTPGGNGENVHIDNCHVDSANCFYYNNSPTGQALCHSISRCSFYLNNGASAIREGSNAPGIGVDVTSFSGTFAAGPLRNTLIECNQCPGYLNVAGGRIEVCDTLIRYTAGSPGGFGHVTIRGMDFDAFGYDQVKYPSSVFGILDDTLSGNYTTQYTDTIDSCRFNGNYSAPFPALKLTSFPSNSDLSKNYFDRCTFTGFSESLTDPSNQTDLSHLGVVVSQCRSAIGSSGLYGPDISYP